MGKDGELIIGDIKKQTRTTMENVQAALKLAGCTLEDVAKVNVWLDDARDFWTFNRMYSRGTIN